MIFVRHAMPAVVADVPSREWRRTEPARADRVLFRLRSAVEHALDTSGNDDIVIAAHGMAPTVYLSSQIEFYAAGF